MAFKFKNPWAADEFVNPWDINGAEAQKVLGDDRSIALDDSKESLSNPPTKEELKRKYDSPSVYSWQGYANDFSEVKIVSTFETVAQKYINLPPSYLYTYAIGEGLNDWIDRHYIYDDVNQKQIDVNLSDEIEGFRYLGTDYFCAERDTVLKPYLPEGAYFQLDCEYFLDIEVNELGDQVPAATFMNLEKGIIGLGATFLHRRDLFKRYSKKYGYPTPTEDQTTFWAYVFFQQGEGNAMKMLKANKSNSYTRTSAYSNTARDRAIERLATWRYVQGFNIFSS